MLYRDSSILAIEYQCATISVARLQSRTAGYRRVDIPVVWVLGPNYQHIDTITQAQAWLRYSSKWGWHLLFWHGPTQQLEIRHHIVFTVQARLHYQTTLENRRRLPHSHLRRGWSSSSKSKFKWVCITAQINGPNYKPFVINTVVFYRRYPRVVFHLRLKHL